MTIRVLVADDNEAFREALADLVRGEPDLEVVGVAAGGPEAVKLATRTRPDVAILDVRMPGGGPASTERIRTVSPATRVLALSAYDDRGTVISMLRAGAVGYLLKGDPPGRTLEGIRFAHKGEHVLSRAVTGDVVRELIGHLERSEQLTERLQRLDRTKTELIQVLAHELRTPVSVIQAFAGLLAERAEELTRDRIRELIPPVLRASSRVGRLAGNITAAVELALHPRLSAHPTAVAQLISKAVAEFSAQNGVIRAHTGLDEDIQVWADRELAVRAMTLVIENALDVTPEGEHIDIEVIPRRDDVAIIVSDRGPGIPDALREDVLDLFVQVDMSEGRERPGAGVGLYLVRRIMEIHGGDIRISARKGGGTHVALSFPAPVRAAPSLQGSGVA